MCGGRRSAAAGLVVGLLAGATILAAPPTALANRGPSLYSRIQTYLQRRQGAVGVAVYDEVAHTLMTFNGSLTGFTASIVKVDILETLLHQTRGRLSTQQRSLARGMIEHSDNDDATILWQQVGGGNEVAAYNRLLGLTATTPDPDGLWGLTTTSASDQVTLVRALLHHSRVLTDAARRYAQHLITHVEADQRWGVSMGPPKHIRIGLKNGWLPVAQDHDRWAVNSIGFVDGHHSSYEIAVITQHDPSESYGIDTIEHISNLVWNDAATS